MARTLLRVALTGGIATGKSFCLARFAELGVPTWNADVAARELIQRGTPGFDAVVARYGDGVLTASGDIDRATLGRIVFSDAGARRDLEAIIHPGVFSRVTEWFDTQAAAFEMGAAPPPALAIADIPLLYESESETRFDRVVVAACPPDVQLDRLVARDRLTSDDARLRIAAQWPIDEKRRRADYVIDTAGSIEDTRAAVTATYERLAAEAL